MDKIASRRSQLLTQITSEIEDKTQLKVRAIHPIDEDKTQNKNFILESETGNYFMKVYTSGSLTERLFEARVLNELQETGLGFATNVLTNEPLLLNDLPVMLFEVIDGTTLHTQEVSSELIRDVTAKLAQMHNTLKDFNPGEKQRFNALGFEFISEFQLDTTDAVISKGINLLKQSFSVVDESALLSTIIHDDLSLHNVMLTRSGELRFIDFDDAHRSYRISDIGTIVKEFIIQPSGKIDTVAIDNLIKSYESVKNTPPLSQQERQLVIPMALRRALFMYAYYSMTEQEKHLRLQSKQEYSTVATIIDTTSL